MSKDLDSRLAALERGYAKEKEAREKLEAELAKSQVENKRLRAQAIDQSRQQGHTISALNTMRDLHQGRDNPFSEDPREKYEELRAKTLKDKAGNAYYFTDGPAYVGERYYVGFRNSPKGDQADYIVVIPVDRDPSLQWEPVELGGVDARTGQPILRPLGTGEKMEQELAQKQAELSSQFVTNTELNEQQSKRNKELAGRGARAGGPPAPGAGPGDPKPIDVPPGPRPSDTQVG